MEMDVQEWVGVGITRIIHAHGLVRFVFRDSKGKLRLATSLDGITLACSMMPADGIYYIPKGI